MLRGGGGAAGERSGKMSRGVELPHCSALRGHAALPTVTSASALASRALRRRVVKDTNSFLCVCFCGFFLR